MRRVGYKAHFPDPTRAKATFSSAMEARGIDCSDTWPWGMSHRPHCWTPRIGGGKCSPTAKHCRHRDARCTKWVHVAMGYESPAPLLDATHRGGGQVLPNGETLPAPGHKVHAVGGRHERPTRHCKRDHEWVRRAPHSGKQRSDDVTPDDGAHDAPPRVSA